MGTARLLETPAVHERLEAELRQERSEREEVQHELAAEQEDAWTAKDEVAKAVAMRASLQRQLEATTQLQEECAVPLLVLFLYQLRRVLVLVLVLVLAFMDTITDPG